MKADKKTQKGVNAFICLDCGSVFWEEYNDCCKTVYLLNKKVKHEEIGNIIKRRCYACKSENLLNLKDKEMDKIIKLLDTGSGKKRLELMEKWGWLITKEWGLK